MTGIKQGSMLAFACVCLAACGGSGASGEPTTSPGPTPTPTGSNLTVVVENNDFSPTSLSVAAGQTVTWTWHACSTDPYGYGGQTCVSHGLVFDDGTKSSIQSEGSFSRTFNTKGTFAYHCQVHGTAMSGAINVQ